jgi:hypothetical protein
MPHCGSGGEEGGNVKWTEDVLLTLFGGREGGGGGGVQYQFF